MASHDGDGRRKHRSHHSSEDPCNKNCELDDRKKDLLSGERHRYHHSNKERDKRDYEVEEKSKRDLLRRHDLEERGRERRPDHKREHEHEYERERNRKRRRHHSQSEMERNVHGKQEERQERDRECFRLDDRKQREQSLHDLEREERRRQERIGRWKQPCAEDISNVAVPASSSSNTIDGFDSTKISSANIKRERCIVLKNLFDPKSKMEHQFFDNMRNHLHRGSVRCGVVNHIHIDKNHGRAYMLMATPEAADEAADEWHQSLYEGKVIDASFMDDHAFSSRYQVDHHL